MILLELTIELAPQINETQFLKALKNHLRSIRSISGLAADSQVFNLGSHSENLTFIIQMTFAEVTEQELLRFQAKLDEHFAVDFPANLFSGLKTSYRLLVPYSV